MLRTVSKWNRPKQQQQQFIFTTLCESGEKKIRARKIEWNECKTEIVAQSKWCARVNFSSLSPNWNYQKFTRRTKDSDFHALMPLCVSGGSVRARIILSNFKMLCNHKNVQLLWPRTHFKLTAKVNFPFDGRATRSSVGRRHRHQSPSHKRRRTTTVGLIIRFIFIFFCSLLLYRFFGVVVVNERMDYYTYYFADD